MSSLIQAQLNVITVSNQFQIGQGKCCMIVHISKDIITSADISNIKTKYRTATNVIYT